MHMKLKWKSACVMSVQFSSGPVEPPLQISGSGDDASGSGAHWSDDEDLGSMYINLLAFPVMNFILQRVP